MTKKSELIAVFLIVVTSYLFSGCDGGLSPRSSQQQINNNATIKGTIKYIGGKDAWPKDSAFAVRIAAFMEIPQDSNIIKSIIDTTAFINFASLPLFADSSTFSLDIPKTPILLKYIVLAMQTDSTNFYKQEAIGVYTTTGDNTKPSPVTLQPGQTININIDVDFKNLPPQPFK